MATYNLALILRKPENDVEFLLLKQARPPKFEDDEFDSFLDSDLWDLPSARLNLLEGGEAAGTRAGFVVVVEGLESGHDKVNFGDLDFDSAINGVLGQVGLDSTDVGTWRFLKFVEEAQFGPGFVHTVYVVAQLVTGETNLPGPCQWMTVEDCLSQLLNVKPSSDRVGPLVVGGLISDSVHLSRKVHTTLHYQEYPPGVTLVPMKSRTGKPFDTTNLIIFAPENISTECDDHRFVACGDALVVDPGCLPDSHGKLLEIVAALSRNLVVFVTHHHHDHVDGLSVIQKVNPNATLVAHKNTMHRISKDDWSLGYTSVSGGEEICIGDQRLQVIYAPGHTDGHMALLHVATHSLIVGDHCVGSQIVGAGWKEKLGFDPMFLGNQGSAVLDVTSGGNMTNYFQTTYKFMELAPHVLIPMHGRVNLWPKNMLCGYLKNRRNRESAVLKAIENGAQTLFDIVAYVYSEVDRRLWIHASSNVRLHVDHLAEQNKLPMEFSLDAFNSSLVEFADKVGVQIGKNEGWKLLSAVHQA